VNENLDFGRPVKSSKNIYDKRRILSKTPWHP
jgi:hypothetical protein